MNTPALYVRDCSGEYVLAESDLIIAEAKRRLAAKFRRGATLSSPAAAKDALLLYLGDCEHEVFGCFFLDNQHRLIRWVELFRGTIDGASVYPREVVKEALAHNAAAVILCHNHPSGSAEPSEADRHITERLRTALGTVDIRVLDHVVIGAEETYSFAEHGRL